MGFWKRFFKRERAEEAREQDWDDLTLSWGRADFTDSEQRKNYVSALLEQAAEATKEIDLLSGEYSRVTSYLTDIEEIEALPEEERGALNGIAARMNALNRERDRYHRKKNRMKDSEYYRIRQQEAEVQEGIKKLRECEDYGVLIRQDLQRLDRERHAYTYRRSELENMMNNFRGMSVIFLVALVACVGMLLILQYAFRMQTGIGYGISVGAAAVAITFLWVKYTDAEGEKRKVDRAVNKLIQLQNKVKIRYVNNSNLQEYLCIKYNTDGAESLEKLWAMYQQEREERKQYAETETRLEYYQKQLLGKMSNYHVNDPGRWMNQAGALLDKREMVEIRHELIQRRQALRKQLDYNSGVAESVRNEIMDLVKRYPTYASGILEMVGQYEDG